MNYSGTGEVIDALIKIYNEKGEENFWYGGELPECGSFGAKTQLEKKGDRKDNGLTSGRRE